MAFGELTLSIPGESPAISPLTLTDFNGEFGFPRRSKVGFSAIAGQSNWGTAAIAGPAYDYRYVWQVAVNLSPDDALHLRALVNWQDRTYKSQQNGALNLTDELHLLDPEPSPHSRSLVSGSSVNWAGASGYVTGYGSFPVKVEIGEDFENRISWYGTEGFLFRLVEI